MPETVNASVQAALVPAARYLALVAASDPDGSADSLLARPDVSAVLADALEEARSAVAQLVLRQWADAPVSPILSRLLADVDRQYAALSHLRGLVRHAHAAAAPAGRPAAVRHAVLGFSRQVSLRSRLTAAVAETAARTSVTLAEGEARRAAGEKVSKRWVVRRDGQACHWCRRLDGVTIGMDDSFLPYLGGPADLSGHGRLTRPPKPYHGELQGPPLHPRCRCRLMVVTRTGPGYELARLVPPARQALFTASQIRAMPEYRYQALASFLQAALHELGQVLRRIVSAA